MQKKAAFGLDVGSALLCVKKEELAQRRKRDHSPSLDAAVIIFT